MSLFTVLVLCSAAMVGSVKIADMEQGAEFTKCVSITDFETKTINDDITLIDRVGDCCPAGSVPGVKNYNKYDGAQIVCGFKDDGTVALTTGSSNGAKTCTYNKCYIMKQNIPCKDGTKQLINGCCGAKPQTNFDAQCKDYDKDFNNAHGEKAQYCVTYDKDYGSKGYRGTTDKADDVASGKLQVDKVYVYTPCPGSMAGTGASATTGSAATTGSSATTGTAVTTGSEKTSGATGLSASLLAVCMVIASVAGLA